MQRSYSVFCSPPDGAFAKRYPALAHLPCIFDGRPGYHRLSNQYLMERGLGLWRPEGGARTGIPTKKTMRNYAHWLANFLEWTHVQKRQNCRPVATQQTLQGDTSPKCLKECGHGTVKVEHPPRLTHASSRRANSLHGWLGRDCEVRSKSLTTFSKLRWGRRPGRAAKLRGK